MRWNKILSSILFLLLFLVKSSAFHVYTHDVEHADAASHCQTCEIQQLNLLSDFETAVTFQIVPPLSFPSTSSETTKGAVTFIKSSFQTHIYSRPPPSLGVIL